MEKSSPVQKESNSQLWNRVLSAAILLTILIVVVIFGGPLGVRVVTLIAAGVCFFEYFSMLFPSEQQYKFKLVGSGLGMALLFLILTALHTYLIGGITFVLFVLFVFYLCHSTEDLKNMINRFAYSVLGIFYICFFICFLPLIRELDHGMEWLFLTLLVAWASDCGGYVMGKFFGTKKLLPLISPNKTIEGAIGGVLFSAVSVLFFSYLVFQRLGFIECVFL